MNISFIFPLQAIQNGILFVDWTRYWIGIGFNDANVGFLG